LVNAKDLVICGVPTTRAAANAATEEEAEGDAAADGETAAE
jgi:hypothetical protein